MGVKFDGGFEAKKARQASMAESATCPEAALCCMSAHWLAWVAFNSAGLRGCGAGVSAQAGGNVNSPFSFSEKEGGSKLEETWFEAVIRIQIFAASSSATV